VAFFLLDVNVLVAALWYQQSSHAHVQAWLARYAARGWATCPLTQNGFVRLLSNPAFSPNSLTVNSAIALLESNLVHPKHHFWPDEIGVAQAVERFGARLKGYQQLSDAYLLGLAIHKKGRLVTLDRGVLSLLPEQSEVRARVVLI
jgi:toxin-antitoxin system PIN domain toxin